MKIFNFSKWEVIDTYSYHGICYVVQMRINLRSGFKKFKVNRITGISHNAIHITKEQIQNQ